MINRLSLLFCVACIALAALNALSADVTPPSRTTAEVDKLIATEGATTPPWFDSVKLNFPPTLLLHWEKPKDKEPWTPSKYLGQYIWSVVNENPGQWRNGLKLSYHVTELNKDDPEKSVMSMKTIARNYQYLQQDYLRAAYWWRKSGVEKDLDALEIATCFAKLGNKDYPRKILEAYGHDNSRHGSAIKLWADIGEYDKALELAKFKAEEDDADIAWLMAGETYKLMGNHKEAIESFQKVLALDDKKCGRDVKQTKARAKASIEAVQLFDAQDLTKIADGTYTADSYGYSGQVAIAATVKAGKIESVKVAKHTEKQYYGALTDTPAKILQKQSVKGIDAFSGATITSEAIINATAKALAKGVK